MKYLRCKKCGTVDSFYTLEKGVHHIAYCSNCRAYIKHLPRDDPKFYFGKYKGLLVNQIEDVQYLQWALGNINFAESMRDAIRERINTLHELTR